jgi:hypothetical protein
MSSSEIAALAERGRAFKQEAFTPEFMITAGQHVVQAPDYIIGQYSLTEQYHVTQAANMQRILAEGLQPGVALLDPEDTVFFEEAYADQQHRKRVYSDDRIVAKYILGTEVRGVYTTADNSDYHVRTFAVPERTRFFMRNMNALSKHTAVSESVQQHAQDLVAKYTGRLVVDGAIRASVLRVDPRSPQLARAVIRPYDFNAFGPDFSLAALKQDQQDSMLEITETIPPEYLSVQNEVSYDADTYIEEMISSTGQVVFN